MNRRRSLEEREEKKERTIRGTRGDRKKDKKREALFAIMLAIGKHLKMNMKEISKFTKHFVTFLSAYYFWPLIDFYINSSKKAGGKIVEDIKIKGINIAVDMIEYFKEHPSEIIACAGTFLLEENVDIRREIVAIGRSKFDETIEVFQKEIFELTDSIMKETVVKHIVSFLPLNPLTIENLAIGYMGDSEKSLDLYISKELEKQSNLVSEMYVDRHTKWEKSSVQILAEKIACPGLIYFKDVLNYDLPEACIKKPYSRSLFEENCRRINQDLNRKVKNNAEALLRSTKGIIKETIEDFFVETTRSAGDVILLSQVFTMFVMIYLLYSALYGMVGRCFAKRERRRGRRTLVIEEIDDEKENMKFPSMKRKSRKGSRNKSRNKRKSKRNSSSNKKRSTKRSR